MATSNIVNTLGAGSGIDIKALAESLVEAERAPRKERIESKISQSEARISGYGAIKYSLSQLKSAFEKINDASEFASVKATNSLPAALSVSASAAAKTGSYSLKVQDIATEQRTASEVFASRDVTLNGGQPFSFSLTIGSGAATPIAVAPTTAGGVPRAATPADVVSAINSANTGVSAQLLNTGSGFQIVLSGQTGASQSFGISTTSTVASNAQIETSNATQLVVTADPGTSAVSASYTDGNGATVSLTLAKNNNGKWVPPQGTLLPPDGTTFTLDAIKPAVSFHQGLQSAQDARFEVNGLPITRSTNSINDVIDGVTLNLFASTGTSAARLDLNRETATIKDNLRALVTIYNEFNANLKVLGDAKSDVETFGGALAGDSLVQSVRNQVRRLISDPSSTPGTTIQAARNVGLSIDRDGVLQLDESKLDQALQDNFSEVVTMFTANKSNVSVYNPQSAGLANDAVRKLDEMLRSSGVVEKQTASAQKQITAHKAELERLQEQMDKLLSRYMDQFSVMESIVGESNSLRSSLKGTFEGMMKAYSS